MGKKQEIVLVTGGSGFLGQHIIRELQLHDPKIKEIRVLDIKPYTNSLGHIDQKPVVSFIGDVTKPETCEEAFKDVDCVIHAAALVTYKFPADEEALERVNVQGTRNVVELCREKGVGRLVYISTAEVAMRPRFMAGMFPLIVGQNEIRALPLTKNDRLPAYIYSKLKAERHVLAAEMTHLLDASSGESQGNLRTIVLRPTHLYGELDTRTLPSVMRAASWAFGNLISPTGYGGRQQFTYAGNAAWACVLAKDALGDPSRVGTASGMPMFVTDDTCVDHAFVLAQRLAAPKVHMTSAWLPSLFTYPLSTMLESAASILRFTLPIQPTAIVSFLGGVINFSRLRAALHLNYVPQYSENEAIDRTKEFLAPILKGKNLHLD